MEYGVNITNKFAFLSGDEDNQDADEIIAKAQLVSKEKASALKKDAKKAPVAPVEKKPVVPTNTNSVNKENVDHRRQPRRDGPPRQNVGGFERKGGRGPPRKTDENGVAVGGDSRPPRNFNNRQPRDGENRGPQRRFRNDGPRQRPAGEGGDEHHTGENRPPRHEGGPRYEGGRFNNRRGPPRGDRVSGSDRTGVRAAPKRDGAGKGNWGNDADEASAAVEGATEANPTANESNENAEHGDNAGENAGAEGTAPDVEPQVRQLTLKEYKAKCKPIQPNFSIRKPGENAAEKKLVPIKRADADKPDTKETEEVQTKRGPREKALNIEVSFNSTQRGGRGGGNRYRDDERGGNYRGGERRGPPGGNYRGGDRRSGGGRNAPQSGSGSGGPQFNLTQESFPALGAR